jgi:hypothetical protein
VRVVLARPHPLRAADRGPVAPPAEYPGARGRYLGKHRHRSGHHRGAAGRNALLRGRSRTGRERPVTAVR